MKVLFLIKSKLILHKKNPLEEISHLKDSISIKLEDHHKKVNTLYSRLDEINYDNYRTSRLKRIY